MLTGKPMLSKVGTLGDRYWTWIHQPYDGVLRLFESDLLEIFTRTYWWVIPIFWMPLVIFFTIKAYAVLFPKYG